MVVYAGLVRVKSWGRGYVCFVERYKIETLDSL